MRFAQEPIRASTAAIATVIAHFLFDMRAIDFNAALLAASSVQFLNDANITSPEGFSYQDAVQVSYSANASNYRLDYAGSGFLVNGSNQATAGTVTGIFQSVQSGPSWFADWGIEGISVTAVSVANAFASASTADDDTLLSTALAGNDVFDLKGATADFASGYNGNDLMLGAGGNDTLNGGNGNDSLDGGSGNDRLVGNNGIDSMTGGSGNDTYVVGTGDVLVEIPGAGTDEVNSAVSFTLAANLEDLTLTGTAATTAVGNASPNWLTGNTGANTLSGLDGNDTLVGGQGNDTLIGGNEADFVRGLAGNDLLRGGLGEDSLIGGLGNDTFQFDSTLGAGNVDIVADLKKGIDKIALDDDIFSAFNAAVSTTITTGDVGTRIIYTQSTGALLYDADGAGGGAAVQFATLSGGTHPTLSPADIVGLILIVG